MKEALKRFFINKKMYFLSLGIVLLFVFPLFVMEYSTDTYHVALSPLQDGLGMGMLSNGRFITGISAIIFGKLGADAMGFYYFSLILAVFCASMAIYQLYTVLRGHMWKNLAFFLAFIKQYLIL